MEEITATKKVSSNNITHHKLRYIPDLTDRLKQLFKSSEIKEVKLGIYNNNKLQIHMSNMKDKIEKGNRTKLVYQLECKDCEQVYIGESRQYVSKRAQQHQVDARNVKNINKSALANHAITMQHVFDFENPKILNVEAVAGSRKILESIHITQNLNKTVNFKTDVGHIGNHYVHILSTLKKWKQRRHK